MATSRSRPVYEDGIHDIESPSFRTPSNGANLPSLRTVQPPIPSQMAAGRSEKTRVDAHNSTRGQRASGPPMAPSPSEKTHANVDDSTGEQRSPPFVEWGQNPYGLSAAPPFLRQYPVQGTTAGLSYQNSSTHDAQTAYLQKLVGDLRNANNTKSQLITDLQIKIAILENELKHANSGKSQVITDLQTKVAVLENELKHATQAKDSSLNSLGFIVHAFSQASSMNQTSLGCLRLQDRAARNAAELEIQDRKDMEREIEGLRKTNRRLKREAQQNQEVQERGKLESHVKVEYPREIFRAHEIDIPSKIVSFEIPSKGKNIDSRFNEDWRPSSASNKLDQTPSRASMVQAWKETLFEDSPSAPVRKPDVSFATDSATVPSLQISPCQSTRELQDEFKTLDEVFYESDDTECREKKAKTDAYFGKVPSPGVLKTDIEIKGTYMGNQSEFVSSRTTHRNSSGGVRPDGHLPNQSVPPTLQKSTFGITGSPSSDLPAIWSSTLQRDKALQYHKSNCLANDRRCPNIFIHGLEYVPEEYASNLYTTVNISNLPKDVSLRDVIARVRGGELYSSFLCNTYKLTGGMTVRVVFKYEASATAYVDFCADHPLIFFSNSEPIPRNAIVAFVETPTYPSNQTRLKDQSRCLYLRNLPIRITPYELQEEIGRTNGFRNEALLEFFIDKDRNVYLQFASIDAAGSTLGLINGRRSYRELGIFASFWDDPCDGSVDELLIEEDGARKWSKPTFVLPTCTYDKEKYASIEPTPAQMSDHQRKAEIIKNGGEPRTPLVLLPTQEIEVPSFSGRGIGGSSWADEVIEEQKPSSSANPNPSLNLITPAHQLYKEENLSVSSTESFTSMDINRLMADGTHKIWETQTPPPGLSASKHTTLIPSSEPSSRGRTPSPLSLVQNTHPVEHHRAHVVLDYGEDTERPAFGARAEKEASIDEEKSPCSSSSGDSAMAIIRLIAKGKSRETIRHPSEPIPANFYLSTSTPSMGRFEIRQEYSKGSGADIEDEKANSVPLAGKSILPSASSSSLAQLSASMSAIPSIPRPGSSTSQPALMGMKPDEIQHSSSPAPSPAADSSTSPRVWKLVKSNGIPLPSSAVPTPVLCFSSSPPRVLKIVNPDEIIIDSEIESELEEGEIRK